MLIFCSGSELEIIRDDEGSIQHKALHRQVMYAYCYYLQWFYQDLPLSNNASLSEGS